MSVNLTINDLCDSALEYILTIDVKNKTSDSTYTIPENLQVGYNIETYSKNITWCTSHERRTNNYHSTTITQNVTISESIDSSYTTPTSNTNITNDWNAFKTNYVLTKIPDGSVISLSSLFAFIYLLRCFMDAKFKVFTDTYENNPLWLYNTSTVNYNIDSNIKPITNILKENMELDEMNIYTNALVDEILSKSSPYALQSKLN